MGGFGWMTRWTYSLAAVLSVVSGGCSGTSEAGQAAVATGVLVAATAAHRAATGDCWGRCSPGYVCNREKGFCEPGECDPACPAGYSCTVTPTGTSCQSTPSPVFNPNPNQAQEASVSSPSGRAEGNLPSRTPATQPITPARSSTGQVLIEEGNPGPYGGEPATTTGGGTRASFPEPSASPERPMTPTSQGSADTSCERSSKENTEKNAPQEKGKCAAPEKSAAPSP